MKYFALFVACSLSVAVAQTPSGPRAGIDWPGFRGIAARGVDDGKALPVSWSVPESRSVKWRVPVAGLGHSSPVVWGDMVCTASAVSGTPDPQLKVGLYGDIGSVLDDHVAQMAGDVFRQEHRQAAMGAHGEDRRADREAPPQVHARQLHAGHRRPHVVAMFGSEGLYAYDVNGTLVWQKDFGAARLRLLHGAGRAVGIWQLAGDPQRPGDRAGRRAEGLVRRGVRRAHRQGIVAHRARRRADVEHAGGGVDERPRPGGRQRLETHRRLRSRDRQRGVAHDRRRRHPGADANRRARPGVHHQRPRQVLPDLCDQADRDRRHHIERGRDIQRAHCVELHA